MSEKKSLIPEFTAVQNFVIDQWMPRMSDPEFRVVIVAIRKIIGYHKDAPEPISLSQFQKATGLSRSSVLRGIEAAVEHGILNKVAKGKRNITHYELVLYGDWYKFDTSTMSKNGPVLYSNLDTQKKGSKESLKKTDSAADSGDDTDTTDSSISGDDWNDTEAIEQVILELLENAGQDGISFDDLAYELNRAFPGSRNWHFDPIDHDNHHPFQNALNELLDDDSVQWFFPNGNLNGQRHYRLSRYGRSVEEIISFKGDDLDRLVTALGAALGIAATRADRSNYIRVGKILNESGIGLDDFQRHVDFCREEAQREGWSVTINSLISNGRVSRSVHDRDKPVEPRTERPVIRIDGHMGPPPKPTSFEGSIWDVKVPRPSWLREDDDVVEDEPDIPL